MEMESCSGLSMGLVMMPAPDYFFDEYLCEFRIELASHAAGYLLYSLIDGQSFPVRPVRGHGVKGIGERDDPGKKRYILPRDPRGISPAVVAFMVVPNDLRLSGHGHNGLYYVRPDIGVALDDHELFIGEPVRLKEDAVGYSNLPDIVE